MHVPPRLHIRTRINNADVQVSKMYKMHEHSIRVGSKEGVDSTVIVEANHLHSTLHIMFNVLRVRLCVK